MRITISITNCSASKNFNNLSYTSTKIGNYEKNLLKMVDLLFSEAEHHFIGSIFLQITRIPNI